MLSQIFGNGVNLISKEIFNTSFIDDISIGMVENKAFVSQTASHKGQTF